MNYRLLRASCAPVIALSLAALHCGGGAAEAPAPVTSPSATARPAAGPITPTPATAAAEVKPDVVAGADAARDAELAATADAAFGVRNSGAARLHRDGQRFVFSSTRDGVLQLYVGDRKGGGAPRLLTKTGERVHGSEILPGEDTVLFRSDVGADEHYAFYRVGIDGTGLTPLTPDERLMRDPALVPRRASARMFYSARTKEEPGTRLYAQSTKRAGDASIVYREPTTAFGASVTDDGKRVALVRVRTLSDSELVVVDVEGGAAKKIYPPDGTTAMVSSADFAPDGSLVVATDGGKEEALLLRLDPSGRELARTSLQPSTAQIRSVITAPRGGAVAVGLSAGDHDEVMLVDQKTLKTTKKLALPLGSGKPVAFSEDGRELTVTFSTPSSPPTVFSCDVASGKVKALLDERNEKLDALTPVSAERVTVASFDGTKVPVNVYLPRKEGDRTPVSKRPVLVMVHGGPAAASTIGYSPLVRFYSAAGYVVVEPNVRGSTGFGRAYEQADDGKKRLDALRDLEHVARWTRDQSWADPDKLVVWGGSYGGYMVLMALTRQPELWAGGVDLVGISSWRSFMKTTTGAIREILSKEFGSVEADGEFLDSISPLRDATKIRAPLFVFQGQNDPRVPRSEADQIVRALRERKVPVEYMVAPDEGHSLDKRPNQIAFASRTARFLERQVLKR